MIRRPPSTTRPYTLVPYTTLFRSRLQLREFDLVTHRTRHDERLFRAEPEAALRRGDDRDIARGEGDEDILFLKPLQARCDDGFGIIAALPVAPGGDGPPGGEREQRRSGEQDQAGPTKNGSA